MWLNWTIILWYIQKTKKYWWLSPYKYNIYIFEVKIIFYVNFILEKQKFKSLLQ